MLNIFGEQNLEICVHQNNNKNETPLEKAIILNRTHQIKTIIEICKPFLKLKGTELHTCAKYLREEIA